jgi:uncharacterized protein
MTPRNKQLHDNLHTLYQQHTEELLFHGWHHITFVTRKSLEFAKELQVKEELVEATALTHDLNYLVDVTSGADAGKALRAHQLGNVGYSDAEIAVIEDAVHSGSTENRHADIPALAKALSDADSLFKVLPVGPLLLSARYITETKVDLKKWSDRIIRDQQPLLDQDIFFYTDTAKRRYSEWAKLNLQLVATIRSSLDDPDIQLFLEDCKTLGFL